MGIISYVAIVCEAIVMKAQAHDLLTGNLVGIVTKW